MNNLKEQLYKMCIAYVQGRINDARQSIEDAQDSSDEDTKSSAGDKYETGRAMGHLQKDMHTRQLAEWTKELTALQALPIEPLSTSGRPGAFLQAADISFFISAGLGRQSIDGQTILFLSPQAPLAMSLQAKTAGDSIIFNGEKMVIREVF